ncbi:MAG: hypothetical protein UT50_C0002G0011 [Candidatus Moranbacteria bacterium GW2011_GWA2_39_41]|nr:MAG: hypothetical protein UT50_C0002G0011 [Candidatus Moranbacteria bacterium GW2011_GWA2_39_41]
MKIKKLAGISLIETILYLAIAVVILGVLFSYGWNVIGMNIKAQVAQEIEQSAQLIGERLTYEIRNADSVDIANSNFGDSAKLVLLKINEDTVTIEKSGDQIAIKRGAGDSLALNSQDVKIKNFILTQQVSDTNEIQFVGFSFETVANYPGSLERSEYQYALNYRSGVALRK